MKEFTGEYAIIPPLTQFALVRYVEDRIATGGFLNAVLTNNLFSAIAKADESNVQALRAIVRYIYNEMPGNCWGDAKTVKEWLKKD